jgi:hypothetical protein
MAPHPYCRTVASRNVGTRLKHTARGTPLLAARCRASSSAQFSSARWSLGRGAARQEYVYELLSWGHMAWAAGSVCRAKEWWFMTRVVSESAPRHPVDDGLAVHQLARGGQGAHTLGMEPRRAGHLAPSATTGVHSRFSLWGGERTGKAETQAHIFGVSDDDLGFLASEEEDAPALSLAVWGCRCVKGVSNLGTSGAGGVIMQACKPTTLTTLLPAAAHSSNYATCIKNPHDASARMHPPESRPPA